MKLIVFIVALICCSSSLYAGWTAGGGGSGIAVKEDEVLLTVSEMKDVLFEANTGGTISIEDPKGTRDLLPVNFDFKNRKLTLQDPNTGKILTFKEIPADSQ